MQGTEVSDVGLVHLRRLTDLRTLDLRDTHVTRAALAPLKELPKLQRLSLAGTPLATTTDHDLHRALPHVKILR